MESFRDPDVAIHVEAGQAFAIELAGNPTTGYTWCADPAPPCIRLSEQLFVLESTGIGGGGLEVFRFEAQEPGSAEVTFHYRRPWDASPRETKRFQVVVG
jgi:predicted secreted protein